MKYRQQLDITDCGAACLSMIASHFGKHLNIAEVRNVASTDLIGTNMQGLIKAAKHYGLVSKPVKGTIDVLNANTPIPFIAHIHMDRPELGWIDHYVVVKKIGNKKIEIWDPDPSVKKKKVSIEYFSSIWTGYALFLEPGDFFSPETKKKNLFGHVKYFV